MSFNDRSSFGSGTLSSSSMATSMRRRSSALACHSWVLAMSFSTENQRMAPSAFSRAAVKRWYSMAAVSLEISKVRVMVLLIFNPSGCFGNKNKLLNMVQFTVADLLAFTYADDAKALSISRFYYSAFHG